MIPIFPFITPLAVMHDGFAGTQRAYAAMRQNKPPTPERLAKRAKRKAQRQARKRNRT